MVMDKSASVIAAFNAGKLPSHQQFSAAIDRFLDTPLLSQQPTADGGELSAQGKVLQEDVRNILTAYKQLADAKNADDIVQESLWHLQQADISNTSTTDAVGVDSEQARRDARAIARALRTLTNIAWENLSTEGRSLFHDFASFVRLALADAAEQVASVAGNTADGLRQLDQDVQQGDRNEIGVKRKAEDEGDDADVRVKFERTMDATKEVGSKTIGAGQVAAATAQETADRTSARLQDAYYKICDRAQDDPEYHNAVSTIFSLFDKWIHRSLDAAGDVNQATDLEAFLDDPTPDKHLIKGIRGLRAELERLAGGKSLDGFFGALRVCGVDIQNDGDVRAWSDRFVEHLRRSLDERGYARSDEAQKTREKLRREWKELLDQDSDKGRKWKEDIGKLKHELAEFETGFQHDQDLHRVRRAHQKLADDLEESLLSVGATGIQATMEKAPWFWQDVFNVYLPQAISMLKDIPIPRTEYKDESMDLVLEDLDISSFSLLPGHAYIRNITDIDIQAPSAGNATTAVGTLTRVYLQGLQLALREVSFYYYDKTATVGPAEHTGIAEITLPPQGIDVDVVVRTIPSSPEGLKERERRSGVLDIQRVEVKVSEELDVVVRQSNHAVLATVFKPVMVARLREALRTLLEAQIRGALESGDALAWDVARRAEVFADTGLPRGASVVAALWSEAGHLSRGEGGLLSGWRATGTGLVKEDAGGAQFALGAEPQVLSGEKRGPKGTNAEPLAERMDVDVDVDGAAEGAQAVARQAGETAKEGVRKVKSFKESVSAKIDEEKSREGWQSSAFDA